MGENISPPIKYAELNLGSDKMVDIWDISTIHCGILLESPQ